MNDPVSGLIKALEFYATLNDRDNNEPFLRREFGCGCCTGTNDVEGDCDYDSNVKGLTAREALTKYREETK